MIKRKTYIIDNETQALAFIMDKLDNMSKRLDCIFALLFLDSIVIASILWGLHL